MSDAKNNRGSKTKTRRARNNMSKSSELVYTSAPQGLRPGSRGFCTVVMSESMPPGLVGPLESLSAYRHVDGGGPSPVNHMHVQMKVAGRPVNVLTRIAEAPPDYTGRTNKIAHYVVVATGDRAAGGPAAVLRQPGFAIETWDGEVRKISEPKTIPMADSPTRVAQTWAEQTGDAGWAGTVASIFESRTPGPPIYLIYRPEQNAPLLAMVDEAICLLAESKRWNATFSTHTGELPPGVQCRLRCLVAGSPEALALPPSAMTLDLASGNLGSPPPGPLVEAARTGRIVSAENVPPPEMPTAVGQSGIPVPANPPALFETSEPGFDIPPPLSTPSFRAPPSTAQADPSSTRNYVWPLLAVAALLLISIGGAAVYMLQTDPDALLAELGVENRPEEDVTPKVIQEPEIEIELEPVTEPEVAADTKVDAQTAELKKADAKEPKTLEALAEKILKGKAFMGNEGEKSITKLAEQIEDQVGVLKDQKKQLDQLSPRPAEEQLAAWLLAEDGMAQLTGFIDAKKEEIDKLKQHTPKADFQAKLETLENQVKTWNEEAKRWEEEQRKQPDRTLQVTDRHDVEQTIKNVSEMENNQLGEKIPSLLSQYEGLATQNDKSAASIEDNLNKLQTELAKELQERRDSHRLLIYFDGDFNRNEEKLQIKPRCHLTFDADTLAAINRLKVDDNNPAPFEKSDTFVDLPGRYQEWLAASHFGQGVTIKISPRSIPQSIGRDHPVLNQLKVLADQQEKTIVESGKPLRNLLVSKFDSIKESIETEINRLTMEKEGKEKAKRESSKKTAEELNDLNELNKKIVEIDNVIADNKQAIKVVSEFLGDRSVPSPNEKPLDELYLNQGELAIKAFILSQLHTEDKIVLDALAKHVKNLTELREDYKDLKNQLAPIELGGKLTFGKVSGRSNLGQPSFEMLETFDLFFFPELVYSPPPKE